MTQAELENKENTHPLVPIKRLARIRRGTGIRRSRQEASYKNFGLLLRGRLETVHRHFE